MHGNQTKPLLHDSKRERAFRQALGKFYRLETPKGRQSFYSLVVVVRKIIRKINETSWKHVPKLIQNPSTINQKWSQIDRNTSLERFRRQIAPRSAPRCNGPEKLLLLWSLFGRKLRSEGGFRDPPKSQNGSKIALLCIDWRLDPPKMVSGRGFGTNRKINEKIIEKMIKNHEKMVSKFIEKMILFRICDSLFFSKSPMLKWDFYKTRGVEKMVNLMKKRCKKEGTKKSENRCQKGGQK